jgi:hypothetical protein
MATAERHVGMTRVLAKSGTYWVSTVFMGLDHGWGDQPALFETMITRVTGPNTEWGGDHEWLDYQERYATWDQAVDGHVRAIDYVYHRK